MGCGWSISRGVPRRPCRFPIKQMPAGTRATPQAPESISSCSRRTSTNLPPSPFLSLSHSLLSFALVAREGFNHCTCRAACETRVEFTTCTFVLHLVTKVTSDYSHLYKKLKKNVNAFQKMQVAFNSRKCLRLMIKNRHIQF